MSKYLRVPAFVTLLLTLVSCDQASQEVGEPRLDERAKDPVALVTLKTTDRTDGVDRGPIDVLASMKFRKELVESDSFLATPPETPTEAIYIPPTARTVDYPSDGVSLGQGWDSLRDLKRQGQCVQFTSQQAGGQLARVELKRVFDSDSLRRALSVTYSAEASAKFGVGGGSGSMKSSFVSSSEMNQQFVNLLVKSSVQNGVDFASPSGTEHGVIELTSFAKDILKNDDSAFIRQCGDSFVAGIERGAELFALYQFSSIAREDKGTNTLSFSGSGSYLAFSGSGSTSQTKTREAVTKNQVSGLKYLHSAHRGLRLPFNEESIKDAVASLGSAPELADSQPYRVKLLRYDSLPGWPQEKLKSGPATREALVAAYSRLHDLAEVLKDAERNPNNYSLDYAPDVRARGSLRYLIEKRLGALEKLLTACEERKNQDPEGEDRAAVISQCTTRSGDVMFSDYPVRALMPLSTSRKSDFYTADRKKQIEAEITKLNATYAVTKSGGGISLPCSMRPHAAPCQNISRLIKEKEQEKTVYLEAHAYRDLAESRYRYWIEAMAMAREEDGAINGNLTGSELAMYRREIYCQYGEWTPDGVRCPEKSMEELLFDGYVVQRQITQDLDISSERMPTPIAAWNDLQRKADEFIDSSIGRVPHFVALIDPKYTITNMDSTKPDGESSFRVRAKASITYFAIDNEEAARLLATQ